MSVVCLVKLVKRVLKIVDEAHMKNACQLPITTQLDKDTFAQGEPYEIKGLLDACTREVHVVVGYQGRGVPCVTVAL